MSVPPYIEQMGLQQIVDRDIPDLLKELWDALDTAWGEVDDLEAEVERLNGAIIELEESKS